MFFERREAKQMMTFFKTFIFSKVEYRSLLISPFTAGEIFELENVKRSFTAAMTVRNQNWKRVKPLTLLSGAQTADMYHKDTHGVSWKTWSTVHTDIIPSWHDRHGRLESNITKMKKCH